MVPENVKSLPENICLNQELIQEAMNLGCTKAKVILTKTISLSNWMNLQCQFGCSHYGSILTCPPHTPNAEEMAEILPEYEKALLINASPETNVREIVVHLEKYLKRKGFYKAFALCAQPCDLCTPVPSKQNASIPIKPGPLCKPAASM